MRLYLVFWVLVAGVPAADDSTPVLYRIAQTMVKAINRSDNYICVQDLSRFYYEAESPEAACRQPPELPTTPLRVEDRLKLDVAVSQGSEIYSWHGDHKFSASSVGEVVRQGPISSGSFNGYLRNIFGERGVVFTYHGVAKVNGLELFQYDYDVPLAASHYQIQAGKGLELAPFHGSFTARTDTYELYSLTVIANEEKVSAKANICAAETSLTYQSVKIADHQSLLPASFDLLIGGRNSVFTRSKGVYSQCHEYRGESTVKFDMDDSASSDLKTPELQSEPLSAGLLLPIALQSEIDEDTAYAGLPVEATLQHDVKIGKGVKLTRGAMLHGMLTEFQIFHQPSHRVSLKLEFTSITDGNKIYLCNAIHHVVPEFLPGYAGGFGRRGGTIGPVQTRLPGASADGTLIFDVRHLHLGRTYQNEFITVAHSETDSR